MSIQTTSRYPQAMTKQLIKEWDDLGITEQDF